MRVRGRLGLDDRTGSTRLLTVSDTAYAVAVIRASEGDLAEGERLFTDPYARIFAAAGEHAREGTARFLSLPFFRDAIRLRTRHIDDVVREAFARGTRQLVLMGAGFDARALRLPEVAALAVQTFEIDFPALIQAKRALLAEAGVALPGALHHLGCDLAGDFEEPLLDALQSAGFDRARPSFFVWEGVIAYLTADAIDKGLRFMAAVGAPGSQVIFDFSEYSFTGLSAADRALRAGFTGFEEVPFDVLARRHLRGEPAPSAAIVKLGIATR